jgi:hypothetical protein
MTKRIALCLLVSGVMACHAPPCDHVFQEGKIYKAVVLAPYSKSGPYPGPNPVWLGEGAESCNGSDGLVEGASVSLKMVGRHDGVTCREALGMLEQVPPAVSVTKAGSYASSPAALLGGWGLATINGCSGQYRLEYYRVMGAEDPFAVPVPGQTPSVVLLRTFVADAGAGCKTCAEFFVVQLQRPL